MAQRRSGKKAQRRYGVMALRHYGQNTATPQHRNAPPFTGKKPPFPEFSENLRMKTL